MSRPSAAPEMPPPDPPDTLIGTFREDGWVDVGAVDETNRRRAYRLTAEINRAAKYQGRDRDARTTRRGGRYLVVRIDGGTK